MIRNKSISTDDDGAELNQENGQVPEAVTPKQSDADAIFADSMPWNDEGDDDCANIDEHDDSNLQQNLNMISQWIKMKILLWLLVESQRKVQEYLLS